MPPPWSALVAEYPNAKTAEVALRQLSKYYEQAGRWGAVEHTDRRLARRGTSADPEGSFDDAMARLRELPSGR